MLLEMLELVRELRIYWQPKAGEVHRAKTALRRAGIPIPLPRRGTVLRHVSHVSEAAEVGVTSTATRCRQEGWLAENRDALESSNAFTEQHGLPLAEYRSLRTEHCLDKSHPPLVLVDPDIMWGMPCLAGSRLPARTLLDMVSRGDPWDVIVAGWPWLTPAHVEAARRWFADSKDCERLARVEPSADVGRWRVREGHRVREGRKRSGD